MIKSLVILILLIFIYNVNAFSTMNDEEFHNFIKRLKSLSTSDAIEKELNDTSEYCNFNSEQFKDILKNIKFDEYKKNFSINFFPKITDPSNFFIVFSEFSHNTSKIETIKNLPSNNEFTGYTMPYSEETFRNLKYFFSKLIFNENKVAAIPILKFGIYNCEQLTELMKKLNGDELKLKLAIALYPRISDYKNIYKLKEAFTFSENAEIFIKKVKKLSKYQNDSGENYTDFLIYGKLINNIVQNNGDELEILKKYASENNIYVSELSTILRLAKKTDRSEIISIFYNSINDKNNLKYLRMNFPNRDQWREILKKLTNKNIFIGE